jgi:regulator of RNase E activity RraA
MKLFRTIFALSGFVLPSIVSASSSSQILQVHVPFSFVMAGQEFNPGDYRVQQNDNGIVFIQGNGKAAMALSAPA